MNALTIEQIEDARTKVYANAKELLDEADILFAHERYARAYAVAHLACEEVAKLMMLARVGVEVLTGKTVDWKKFFRRFRSHDEKLHNIATFDYFFLSEPDPARNTDIEKYQDDAKRVPELNATKNLSLYVDIDRTPATQPSVLITRSDAETLIALAYRRFAFCNQIEGGTQGRLAEIVKSPSFSAFSKAIGAFLTSIKEA